MQKTIFDSEPVNENGKRSGRLWTEPLGILISRLTFVVLLPIGMAAQAPLATAQASPQAAVLYGSGIQSPLQFAGESGPANQVSLSMGASALYDSNILLTSFHPLSDEGGSFNANLDFTRQTEKLKVSLDYNPYFVLYNKVSQFDRLNHTGRLSLTYRLSPRVMLGLHEIFSYQNGIYSGLSEQPIQSGLLPPTALNQVIILRATKGLTNMAGLDLTFEKSDRTSLTFSGDYDQRKFGNIAPGQPAYSGNGESGSLNYQYRVAEHTSVGMLLLHEDTTFFGGSVFGDRLRTQVESAYLSVGTLLSPGVSVTAFGGPQYLRIIGQGPGLAGHIQASGGASIAKQIRTTALDFSVQRSVSDGGGLYASAIFTNGSFGVRRRLARNWEADLHVIGAQVDSTLFQLSNARTDSVQGGVTLSRHLPHGSVFHISCDYWHQLSKGALPITADFEREQFTVGVDYRIKAHPFGR